MARNARPAVARRGTGERIWDVKRPVGLTSPEFHLYFTGPLTASRAAAYSGPERRSRLASPTPPGMLS